MKWIQSRRIAYVKGKERLAAWEKKRKESLYQEVNTIILWPSKK
jgi:hypothetical protein